MVFYRKYRPQTIADLDSKEVRDVLYSVFSHGSIPHAFLFTGPKGLGKTSTARIVAKVLNCERLASSSKEKKLHTKPYTLNATVEPCNQCEQCKSITNGSNLDILEIDAASNRGIDEIRDLREKIRLAPLSARKKVYIIDEVHMLTTEAFNALLKTLEEPPVHVVFILCTTELHKVPATIISRCFRIQFTFATDEELKSSFKRIVESEKITIDENALLYIARLSDGSFRDGAKILEEVALLSKGKPIAVETVEQKFKSVNSTHQAEELFGALLKKDTKKSLHIIVDMIKQGTDIKFFIEQFTLGLHGLLLKKIGVEDASSIIQTESDYSIEDIKAIAQIFDKAYKDMKYAVLPQLPLELVIIEYTTGSSRGPVDSFPPVSARLVSSSTTERFRAAGSPSTVTTPAQKKTENKDILKELIESLKSKNPSLAGLLRSFTILQHDNESLVLGTKYKYHKERVDDKKMQILLKNALQNIVGKQLDIKIVLRGGEN